MPKQTHIWHLPSDFTDSEAHACMGTRFKNLEKCSLGIHAAGTRAPRMRRRMNHGPTLRSSQALGISKNIAFSKDRVTCEKERVRSTEGTSNSSLGGQRRLPQRDAETHGILSESCLVFWQRKLIGKREHGFLEKIFFRMAEGWDGRQQGKKRAGKVSESLMQKGLDQGSACSFPERAT